MTNINPTKNYLEQLSLYFPNIDRVDILEKINNSEYTEQLLQYLQYSIPIEQMNQNIYELYSTISDAYYSHFLHFRQEITTSDLIADRHQIVQKKNQKIPQLIRKRINFKDLSIFLQSFKPDMISHVSKEVIQMCEKISNWRTITVDSVLNEKYDFKKNYQGGYKKTNNYQNKQEKHKPEKQQKGVIRFKIQTETQRQMKRTIIYNAKNNRFLTDPENQSEIQRISNNINFILNRITVEYFQDFLTQLTPYAKDQIYSVILSQKILEKIQQEHNYIKIYAKLMKQLRKNIIIIQGKEIKFKQIFIENFQTTFQQVVRSGNWQSEQLYKKQLLGMSNFVGQLISIKFLSKKIFKYCFIQLLTSYCLDYKKYSSNKNFFYYETYIQCIVKIIENIGDKYDKLVSKDKISPQIVVDKIIHNEDYSDNTIFHQNFDFIEVIKKINQILPSQRQKITFMLEDLRCNRVIKKQEQLKNTVQFDTVQQLFKLNHSDKTQVTSLQTQMKKVDLNIFMKDYYLNFSNGSIKQVNKNLQAFKFISHFPKICDIAIDALIENIDFLYTIESDYPLLKESLAKIIRVVCEKKRVDIRDLRIPFDHEDEDLREFIQGIEAKYFKITAQD